MILIHFNRNRVAHSTGQILSSLCSKSFSDFSSHRKKKWTSRPNPQVLWPLLSLFPCSLQWSLTAPLKCPLDQHQQVCFHLKADSYEATLCQEFSFSRYTRGLLLHLLTEFVLSIVFCCCCNTSPKLGVLKQKRYLFSCSSGRQKFQVNGPKSRCWQRHC